MAGAVGSGGLGNLAISQGFYRFQNDVTLVSTMIILVIVFVIQYIGNVILLTTYFFNDLAFLDYLVLLTT